MVIKKLRKKKNWSQEQLAALCGVSLRTIQRVEAGNKASLETVKALASVFEVEILTITEDITVIDKNETEWKAEPVWVRLGMIGIKRRSHMLLLEYAMIFTGLIIWWLYPMKITTPLIFIGAYINSKIVAYIDKKGYW